MPSVDGSSSQSERETALTVIRPAFLTPATTEDVAARVLFYATNERYSVVNGLPATPLPDGLPKAEKTKGLIFLVDASGHETGNESLLQEFRDRNVGERVWSVGAYPRDFREGVGYCSF